jgi:hypothetical protein
MIIHTSATEKDIRQAAHAAGVQFTRLGQRGSRKRARAFDVILTGRSPRRQHGGEDYSASWDQWGVFLAGVFTVDPDAFMGSDSWGYYSAAHFHWATNHRYSVDGVQGDPCKREERLGAHQFWYAGGSPTGAYSVRECTDCGDVYRQTTRANWDAFISDEAMA